MAAALGTTLVPTLAADNALKMAVIRQNLNNCVWHAYAGMVSAEDASDLYANSI